MEVMQCWMIGNNVRKYRMKRGMTQEELAEKAQLSCKGLQKVEAGRRGIRALTLMKLSVALDVSMDVLAGFREAEERRLHREAFEMLTQGSTEVEMDYIMELFQAVWHLVRNSPR